jgi:hypothetical protein
MLSARRARQNLWPDPQASIGDSLCKIGSKRCWEAVGPAYKVSFNILREIGSYLPPRHEYLNKGESVPCPIVFGIYMIGRNKKRARPTIVFSCDSKAPRQRAMELVRESKILDSHPGIELAESSTPPILSRPPVPLMGRSLDTRGSVDTERATRSEKLVYCTLPLNRVYGIPIFIRDVDGGMRSTSRKATIGGIVRLGDELFGLTVAHAFLDILEEIPTAQRGEIEFSFEYTSSDEGEEDDEDEEDEDLEVTSQGI